MRYVRVVDHKRTQHYRDRNPPWIRLYNDHLEDYEFTCLQDASKWLAVGLLLIASRCGNRIPADPDWLAKRLSCTEPVDLQPLLDAGLIEWASDPLAGCEHDDSETLERAEQSRAEQSKDMFPAAGNEQEDPRCQRDEPTEAGYESSAPAESPSGRSPEPCATSSSTTSRTSAAPPTKRPAKGPSSASAAPACARAETPSTTRSPSLSSSNGRRKPPEIPPDLRAAIPEIEELWAERMAGFEKKITRSAEEAQLRKAARWLKKWSPAAVRASIERSTGAWQGLFEPEREVEKPKERTVTAADIIAREDAWIREHLTPEEHDEQAN